ncbi:DUF5723 family protein [Algoriphagus boritolerans]|uniref:DUF5723 domain-containing protein n=1 Tax=Algoriphagus boritolerans DSM 17298 = JCM 18970 TaxID=1120964 RepID=A0A1H5ZEE2_9BACT|nr:DUF5723 family protein [Algoriphagus boritolerans]SEG34434.1 hypothetical protein SAMN03080598_03464 [Algoriphagus boritolerans DSM 17298 = JCM 18970]
MKKIATVFLLIALPFSVWSQTFIGNTLDNYSGINSLLLNPANVSGSNTRAEFNFISISAFVGNDYISVNIGELQKNDFQFNFDSDTDTSPSNDNNFFGNVDILGPSVMFRLNDKSGLAVSSRVRGFFNVNNISGQLLESVQEGFDDQSDFESQMTNLSGNVHIWGELGLTYGRVLIENNYRRLRVGGTIKYLTSAGGLFISSSSLGVNFNSISNTLNTSGTLSYASTQGLDLQNTDFSTLQSILSGTTGIGGDLGVVYEMQLKKDDAFDSFYLSSPYKLRLGLSLVDFGKVNYTGVSEFNYEMNASINASDFEDKSLDEILDENYEGGESLVNPVIGLPTSLQFFADYNWKKRLYLSLHGAYSLAGSELKYSNSIVNSLVISPRFESKALSIYSPISFRQYNSGVMWGVGFRLGPLMLGSGSILSNLISSSSKSTDIYIGIKFPVNEKK